MSDSQVPNPAPPQAPEIKELPANAIWQCELDATTEKITVGTLRDLSCRGEYVNDFKKENLHIKFEDQKNDYALKILEVKTLENQSLNLVVTSYKAGKFDNPVFIISDGETSVKVNQLSWNVESVLKSPDEKPEPSMGPFELSMPWWFWTGILGFLLLLCLLVAYKMKKIWERKKLIEELASRSTALTPFNQFNKDFRFQIKEWQQKELTSATRSEEEWRRGLLQGVEKSLREYLMRELLVPALEWTDSQILREIKKRHPQVYKETSTDLKKTLREIQQAKKAKSSITYVDCEQLLNMTRNLTEKVFEIKQRTRK